MNDLSLSLVIRAVDRATAPINAIVSRVAAMAGAVAPAAARVGQSFAATTAAAGALATKVGVLGAVGGAVFKTQFLDTAVEFERFSTILRTLEGSTDGARRSMDWISDFAATTPYSLEQVTDGFVKLRAYGLDPTNGLLRTLGDTASAMGRPLMMAIEAIADATTNEYERLKEFGITASQNVKAGVVTFSYVNRAGEQMKQTVDRNNRKIVESTLSAIWNEKYGGQMARASSTWANMRQR